MIIGVSKEFMERFDEMIREIFFELRGPVSAPFALPYNSDGLNITEKEKGVFIAGKKYKEICDSTEPQVSMFPDIYNTAIPNKYFDDIPSIMKARQQGRTSVNKESLYVPKIDNKPISVTDNKF